MGLDGWLANKNCFAMDRPISKQTQNRRRLRLLLRIGLTLAGMAIVVVLFQRWLLASVSEADFRIGQVEVGAIENTITASGMVLPYFEHSLNAPVNTEIKEVFKQSGDAVDPGDPLLQLDAEFVRLNFESLNDELELAKADLTRLKLAYDKDLRDLAYDDEIKGLEVAGLEAELADTKRLQAIGSATQEEVDGVQLRLEVARLEKKKLENELTFRREVIETDRRKLDLQVTIKEKAVRELERKLHETTVTARQPGVITWINQSVGRQVTEGESLVRIANLERFRIEASCSDRYASRLRVGMPVSVRINDQRLVGRVASILPAVENNTIALQVELEENNHPALRPNLRAEVFLVTDRKEQVLRAPNGPAFNGARSQKLFVLREAEAVATEVRIGLTNADYVEIAAGDLQAGDRIIISDMSDYDHLNRLKLQ